MWRRRLCRSNVSVVLEYMCVEGSRHSFPFSDKEKRCASLSMWLTVLSSISSEKEKGKLIITRWDEGKRREEVRRRDLTKRERDRGWHWLTGFSCLLLCRRRTFRFLSQRVVITKTGKGERTMSVNAWKERDRWGNDKQEWESREKRRWEKSSTKTIKELEREYDRTRDRLHLCYVYSVLSFFVLSSVIVIRLDLSCLSQRESLLDRRDRRGDDMSTWERRENVLSQSSWVLSCHHHHHLLQDFSDPIFLIPLSYPFTFQSVLRQSDVCRRLSCALNDPLLSGFEGTFRWRRRMSTILSLIPSLSCHLFHFSSLSPSPFTFDCLSFSLLSLPSPSLIYVRLWLGVRVISSYLYSLIYDGGREREMSALAVVCLFCLPRMMIVIHSSLSLFLRQSVSQMFSLLSPIIIYPSLALFSSGRLCLCERER